MMNRMDQHVMMERATALRKLKECLAPSSWYEMPAPNYWPYDCGSTMVSRS
jgi:hypothetical protein